MARAINGTVSRKRRKKILGLAKGYRSMRSKAFRKAREAVEKAYVMLIEIVESKKGALEGCGSQESTQLFGLKVLPTVSLFMD